MKNKYKSAKLKKGAKFALFYFYGGKG